MTPLRIALEWYLNPDHLPLIALREAAAGQGDPGVELIVPDDHYDGFEALARGEVDIVVNEPLHLLERHDTALASLGTYFITDGGILLTRASRERLLRGEPVRISSPVSNPVTDGLCRSILRGWLAKQGRELAEGQVSIEPNGFGHVDALLGGWDAAWLAFANIELIDARQRGLDAVLITSADGGIPGFSALELVVRRDENAERRALFARTVARLEQAIENLKRDPAAARALWYAASATAPSAETDAIVDDTLTRFVSPVRPDAARWRSVWETLREQGAEIVDAGAFEGIFAGQQA